MRALAALLTSFLLTGCSALQADVQAVQEDLTTYHPTPAGSVVHVLVYSNSTLVTQAEVQQWCDDLALQFSRDIYPQWDVNATFTLVSTPPTQTPQLIVEDYLLQPGLAPTDQGEQTNTTAYVSVAESLSQNGTPESTAGKEVIELVMERTMCGPVAPYAYPVSGVNGTGPQVLHDFVLPSWFTGQHAPYDYLNVTTGPGEIVPGGIDD